MVKEPINPSHFFYRWAVGVLVAVAALAFSLGNVQAQAPKALVDINTATQQELEAVKGVGAATAKRSLPPGPTNPWTNSPRPAFRQKRLLP